MDELMIITALISGIVLGAIGFIFYVCLWTPLKPTFTFGRKVKEARTFLKDLDKKYPIKLISNDMREDREKELITCGYKPHVIEKAQRLNLREFHNAPKKRN